MLKKLLASSMFIIMIALVASLAVGQTNYNVTISQVGSAVQIAPCPLPGVANDTWTFQNNLAQAIVIKVWNKTAHTVTTYNVSALGSQVHTIAAGDCEVKVFDESDHELAECRTVQCQTPTLTQWGIITLVVLLIGSAVFIMLRRRKAAVPA
jgi:hypothetical protein